MFLFGKIISAVVAFIMLMLPFGNNSTEKKCESRFNGTFIQSWMSSSWDDERWEKEVLNMKKAGIEYLILQCLADKASESAGGTWNVYYDSDVEALKDGVFGGDCLEIALRHCEKGGIKVFVGLNMYDDFWNEGSLSKQYGEVCSVAAQMVEDIYNKYGEKYADSLYGWYFTPEISNGLIRQINIKGTANGINTIIDSINKTDKTKPLLMSPFYSEYLSAGPVLTLANYVRLINMINFRDGDIFAPQDAVGAKWVREKNLEMTWKIYKTAVDTSKVDLKLWANCENFSSAVADAALSGIINPPKTENTVHVTETLDRFVWQMDVASKYAENIITFSYNHYYSPDAVNPAFINTYLDYLNNDYVLESEAPSAPGNMKKLQTENGIELKWDGAEDNIGIAYYRLEKDGEFLARIDMRYGWEETAFTDENGNIESSYTIETFDAAGNSTGKIVIG